MDFAELRQGLQASLRVDVPADLLLERPHEIGITVLRFEEPAIENVIEPEYKTLLVSTSAGGCPSLQQQT